MNIFNQLASAATAVAAVLEMSQQELAVMATANKIL